LPYTLLELLPFDEGVQQLGDLALGRGVELLDLREPALQPVGGDLLGCPVPSSQQPFPRHFDHEIFFSKLVRTAEVRDGGYDVQYTYDAVGNRIRQRTTYTQAGQADANGCKPAEPAPRR
jgi:YD repeat-containing protein